MRDSWNKLFKYDMSCHLPRRLHCKKVEKEEIDIFDNLVVIHMYCMMYHNDVSRFNFEPF